MTKMPMLLRVLATSRNLTLALSAAAALTVAAGPVQAAPAPVLAGTYPSYPPLDMRDPATNQLSGFDIDLGKALSAKLGQPFQWVETNYSEMISAVKTGRIQIFFNGMSDTAERREQIAFVDYLRSGSQFMTMAATPVSSPDAMCGKKIGISRLTNMPAALKVWNAEHCEKLGKPAAIYVPADNSIDGRIQMKQGRTDAVLQDSLTVPRTMEQEKGQYVTVGEPFAYYQMGIGVVKSDVALQQKLAAALQQLIDDGSYAKLMSKWGLLPNSAISKVTINDTPAQ